MGPADIVNKLII